MQKIFLKDMLTYLPSKLLPALTGFITAPILTRLFLPAEYGYYALAVGAYDLLFALACSGLASVPNRFYPAYKAESKLGVFFASLSLPTGVAIAVTSILSFLALFVLGSQGFLPPVLYSLLLISVLIFVVYSIFTMLMEVVRIQERGRLYTVFELFTRYGGFGLGLLLVIGFDFQVEGLLWGEFLALALASPFLLFLTTKGVSIRPQGFRLPVARHMWHFGWPLALGNMAMWGLRLSDPYIIGFFRPVSEVGLYSVAFQLSSKSIDIIVALFLLTTGPIAMNAWESRGREATEKILAMATRLFLILCLPAAVGLSLLGLPLVALLTAEEYHAGYRIVGYIGFSSFFFGLARIATLGLLIGKETRRIGINQIIAALVNLGLNLVLVPRFGFIAAGITTLVGYAVLLALQAHASHPHLTWLFPFKTLRNVVIATTGMGLAVFTVNAMSGNCDGAHLGCLFLSIAVGILVYLILLLLLGEANERERTAAKRFWHQVAGKAG
jgi:O-antigen/teichoic acid export membrane protein